MELSRPGSLTGVMCSVCRDADFEVATIGSGEGNSVPDPEQLRFPTEKTEAGFPQFRWGAAGRVPRAPHACRLSPGDRAGSALVRVWPPAPWDEARPRVRSCWALPSPALTALQGLPGSLLQPP